MAELASDRPPEPNHECGHAFRLSEEGKCYACYLAERNLSAVEEFGEVLGLRERQPALSRAEPEQELADYQVISEGRLVATVLLNPRLLLEHATLLEIRSYHFTDARLGAVWDSVVHNPRAQSGASGDLSTSTAPALARYLGLARSDAERLIRDILDDGMFAAAPQNVVAHALRVLTKSRQPQRAFRRARERWRIVEKLLEREGVLT